MLCPTSTTWRDGGTNPEPVPPPPMPARAKDMVLEDAVALAVGTLTDGDHVRNYWRTSSSTWRRSATNSPRARG